MIYSTKGVRQTNIGYRYSGIQNWSPESPFLYDLDVTLIERGKSVDKVSSYAAMRKVSKNAMQMVMACVYN